jgi:hypothetical protein
LERLRKLLLIALLIVLRTGFAQISPPGLDGANAVAWAAVGFNQSWSKKWSSSIYTGGSFQSNPDNFRPLEKPAIFVLNQETYYSFNNHWQLALCASLRTQKIYMDDPPYTPTDPAWKNEIRYYARLFYRHQQGRWALAYSFRPEVRTFYTTSWDRWTPSPEELRFRWKAQGGYILNWHANTLILANEILFATDQNQQSWTPVSFTEDRFSTYIRHAFKKPEVLLDVGLMHQVWEENGLHYTTYLAIDLLFQNPFSKKN